MLGLRRAWARARRTVGTPKLPVLDPELAAREHLFRAPPFTPGLVAAIERIAPQFPLRADETSRGFWEADQNGACWGEYEALAPFLDALPAPSKVLEIGPGLGRSVVFFRKRLGWENADYHLYDSQGGELRYTILGPRFSDSFCGDLSLLRDVLSHNGVGNVTIHDASSLDGNLARLPGPFDVIYSFYSVGFHWSLEHFLDELLELMHEHSVAFFTVPDRFELFTKLDQVNYRLLPLRAVWPQGTRHRILLLSKGALPECAAAASGAR